MSPLALVARSARAASLTPREALARAAALLARWRMRARTRRDLAFLPAHLLRDIGLDQAAAEAEARRPFWRG